MYVPMLQQGKNELCKPSIGEIKTCIIVRSSDTSDLQHTINMTINYYARRTIRATISKVQLSEENISQPCFIIEEVD